MAASEVFPAGREVELPNAPATRPPVRPERANEPPPETSQSRARGSQEDLVVQVFSAPREAIVEADVRRESCHRGVYFIPDGGSLLSRAGVRPIPSSGTEGAFFEDLLTRPQGGGRRSESGSPRLWFSWCGFPIARFRIHPSLSPDFPNHLDVCCLSWPLN